MSESGKQSTGRYDWRGLLKVLLLILCVILVFGWPFWSIQWRLWRNGAIARDLVHSLEVQFPGIKFQGIAAYDKDVVHILVGNNLDANRQLDVERWLRDQKQIDKIKVKIWIKFSPDVDYADTIKIE